MQGARRLGTALYNDVTAVLLQGSMQRKQLAQGSATSAALYAPVESCQYAALAAWLLMPVALTLYSRFRPNR
jgi:hypothetical protein